MCSLLQFIITSLDTVHISSGRIGIYLLHDWKLVIHRHARTHQLTHSLILICYVFLFIAQLLTYCQSECMEVRVPRRRGLPHAHPTLLRLLQLSFHEQRADWTSDMLIGTCNCSLISQQRCTISLIAAKVKWSWPTTTRPCFFVHSLKV